MNVNKYSYPVSILLRTKKASISCQFTCSDMLLFQSIFNKGAVNIPSLLSHITPCQLLISNKLTVYLTMKLNLPTGTPPHPSWSRVTTRTYKPTGRFNHENGGSMFLKNVSNASHFTRLNTQNWNKYHYTTLHTQRKKSKHLCRLKSHFPAEI